ncbi:MAG: ABC transporter ATP-binding protein [Anaerolineae bacterium]|jgi:ABC-type sugar transport system ATPase subunit
MTKIRIENVRKVFEAQETSTLLGLGGAERQHTDGPQVALDGVNLLVRHGETMALLGPSGCGKSTLLRAVAGLISYEGHVYYDDRLVDGLRPHERNIGLVFQNYALYPQFSGYGNLSFTFLVRRRPLQEARERIQVTSEIMGIGFRRLLQHKPGQLSGGEQQRLAVGRALVRTPDLFLFDEPLSNLDARLRIRTRGEIKRLLGRFGHTTLYVTHDQAEATALGDRLALMRAGRIEQVGTYALLYERPINTFVAGFLGSPPMTLLPGRLNERGAWQCGALEVHAPEIVCARMRVGWSLVLGIRPEHARLASDESPTFSGRVEHIERDMSRRVQTLFVALERALPDIAVTVPSSARVQRGDSVPVVLPADKVVFFDGKTEKRIA